MYNITLRSVGIFAWRFAHLVGTVRAILHRELSLCYGTQKSDAGKLKGKQENEMGNQLMSLRMWNKASPALAHTPQADKHALAAKSHSLAEIHLPQLTVQPYINYT